jgi:hypothetical protein
MLRITKAQLSAFEEAVAAQFATEFAHALETEFAADPDLAGRYAAADLLRLCQDGIARGRRCGLRERDHLYLFARVGAVLGEEFYDLLSVRMVVEDAFLTPDEKTEFLVATMVCVMTQQNEGGDDAEPVRA